MSLIERSTLINRNTVRDLSLPTFKAVCKTSVATILAFLVYVGLVLVQWTGWLDSPVTLGTPTMAQCAPADRGYHCVSNPASLQMLSFPIMLSAHRVYMIRVTGRSLTSTPAPMIVDFYADGYDSPIQEGTIWLQPKTLAEHVLQWPSQKAPSSALLRIFSFSHDAPDSEIAKIQLEVVPAWLSVTQNMFRNISIVLFLVYLWNRRQSIRSMMNSLPWKASKEWIEQNPSITLIFLLFGIILLLLIRNISLGGPIVFADEMSYALLSVSRGDPSFYSNNSLIIALPNKLFFYIYHFATQFAEVMLPAARALNSLLFVLAGFPLYAIARRFLTVCQSVFLVGLLLLLPNNSYTGYFMPESFYFFIFTVVAWVFIKFLSPDGHAWQAACTGIALAILSLIKPHGLTVLVACSLTLLIAVCTWRNERRRIAVGWLLLLAFFFTCRFALDLLLSTADTNTSLFGRLLGFYSGIVTNTLHTSLDSTSLRNLFLSAYGNLGSFLLLMGMPLVAITTWLLRKKNDIDDNRLYDRSLDRMHLFVLTTLICLLVGTIKFTVYIADTSNPAEATRIHERYYDFIFGLLLIGAWASVCRLDERKLPTSKLAFAVIVILTCGAAWYMFFGFRVLQVSMIDHPILFALGGLRQRYYLIPIILALPAASLLFLPKKHFGLQIYTYSLSIICLSGFYYIWQEQAISQIIPDQDRASLALKLIYSPEQLEHGLIVGNGSNIAIFRAPFHLRNNAFVRNIPSEGLIDPNIIAPNIEWVLTYGRYQITQDWSPLLKFPADAILYHRAARDKLQLETSSP